MQQQAAGAVWHMVLGMPKGIALDVRIEQQGVVVSIDDDEGIGDLGLAGANRLHFRTLKHQTGDKGLADVVAEGSLAVENLHYSLLKAIPEVS